MYALERPIIQAYVLVFKLNDRTKPIQTFALDLRMSKDDINKEGFIRRLQFREGLNTKSSELGLGSTDVVVGYSQKSPNGTLCNFVESITNSQWEIAVEKVVRSCEQAPKLTLTVKVVEVDDKHPLTRHTCSGPTVGNSKEAPAVSPRDGQPSDESSRKKGGKSKRKAREVHEDTLLWAKLKAGTQFTRNKRQDERLRQWKENVASEYEGCEALDERKIKCFCGTVFTINKMNAIKDVGRAHVRKCMKTNNDRQKREVESKNLQKYWANFLKK